MPDSFLCPLGPVESAGLELFQVEIEGFGHIAAMAPVPDLLRRYRDASTARKRAL
jgi:hypothetical protein